MMARKGGMERSSRPRRGLRARLPLFASPGAIVRFFKDRSASRRAKILVALAVVYVILPVDLIPDWIPLIGWLDDLGVSSLVIAHVASKISEHERRRRLLEEAGLSGE